MATGITDTGLYPNQNYGLQVSDDGTIQFVSQNGSVAMSIAPTGEMTVHKPVSGGGVVPSSLGHAQGQALILDSSLTPVWGTAATGSTGLPAGWTADSNNPAALNANGGSLAGLKVVGITSGATPADGAISAGTAVLVFDQTNGAARLIVKGKSQDGTVSETFIPLDGSVEFTTNKNVAGGYPGLDGSGRIAAAQIPDLSATYAALSNGLLPHSLLPALLVGDIPALTLAKIIDAGSAAAKNVPGTGNASASQVVLGSDSRLSDARTPFAHGSTHAARTTRR